jgi:hypothetical protein
MAEVHGKFLDRKDLKLVVLNGNNPNPEHKHYYNSAFAHWHRTWEEHFKERDGISALHSDNFTRQDDLLALFWKDVCISVICYRRSNMEFKANEFDSYFSPWDKESINQLCKHSQDVIVCSQVSVEPGYNRIENTVKVTELMTFLSVHLAREAGVTAFTGTARKDKGMHNIFAKYGAQLIKSDVPLHNGFVDLMAFYPPKDDTGFNTSVVNLGYYLWRSKAGQLKNSPQAGLNHFLKIHEEKMSVISKILSDFPWESKQAYSLWCGQFYYFVCHATRLLAASAAHLGLDKDPLHIRFLDHMQEEKHHEKLFERDLTNMGFDVTEFKEWPVTAQLYQSQYYLIDYVNPLALLGSIFYLEGLSICSGPELLERTLRAHGDGACTFLKVHVGEDIDHIEKAKNALKQLNENEIRAVTMSYEQTAFLFENLMQEITNTVQVARKKAA